MRGQNASNSKSLDIYRFHLEVTIRMIAYNSWEERDGCQLAVSEDPPQSGMGVRLGERDAYYRKIGCLHRHGMRFRDSGGMWGRLG